MKTFFTILKESIIYAKTYKKNATIYHEGDKCSSIGIVLSGHLRIVSTTADGNDLIYKDVLPNNMFGQNLLFSSDPHYRGDVLALEDSKILLLNKDEFLTLLKTNNDFLELYLRYQSDESKKLNQTIKTMSIQTSKEKLLYFLKINHGSISFKSITDLSKKLNISREATSRTVHKLAKENVISLKENAIEIK